MQLPKAHTTPKLESLPKGLKARAEKIIAKKFGIPDAEAIKKRQEEVERQARKAMQEAENMWTRHNFDIGDRPVFPDYNRQVNFSLYDIRRQIDMMMSTIVYQCNACGYRGEYAISHNSLMSIPSRWLELPIHCRQCMGQGILRTEIDRVLGRY